MTLTIFVRSTHYKDSKSEPCHEPKLAQIHDSDWGKKLDFRWPLSCFQNNTVFLKLKNFDEKKPLCTLYL